MAVSTYAAVGWPFRSYWKHQCGPDGSKARISSGPRSSRRRGQSRCSCHHHIVYGDRKWKPGPCWPCKGLQAYRGVRPWRRWRGSGGGCPYIILEINQLDRTVLFQNPACFLSFCRDISGRFYGSSIGTLISSKKLFFVPFPLFHIDIIFKNKSTQISSTYTYRSDVIYSRAGAFLTRPSASCRAGGCG